MTRERFSILTESNTTNMLQVLFAACCFVTLLIFSPTGGAAAPTATEYGVVLNLSGKQRMLSQKMTKEVLLIALDVDKPANLKNLAATSALFDSTLNGLRSGDSSLGLPATESSRILKQLDKIDTIWAGFYPELKQVVAANAVSAEQLTAIAANNLPLLKQMNKAVGLYEKDARKNGMKSAGGLATTINLAGKQRMLTQKMSKELMLIALGVDVENNKLSLLESYSLFDQTLKGLLDGNENLGLPGTTQAHIREQLVTVGGLWKTFKPLMESGADPQQTAVPADTLKKVAAQNLPLLKAMNKAVKMYEKEAAQ